MSKIEYQEKLKKMLDKELIEEGEYIIRRAREVLEYKKILVIILFILLFVNFVSSDEIEFLPSSGEVNFEIFAGGELGWAISYCGNYYCEPFLENSNSCPLDCKIPIETPVGLIGGSAGATYEQIVDCSFGFELVNGKCEKMIISELIKEKVEQVPNYTIYILGSIFILLLIYRRHRKRKNKQELPLIKEKEK